MNKHILSMAAGVLLATGAFAQEFAHTASLAVPMPLNLKHAGDAIHNYAVGAGLRYTFKSESDFTMALGALHEWRNTRLYRGVENGADDRGKERVSLPADTTLALQERGVLERFREQGFERCPGSGASWGQDELAYNDFLQSPYGESSPLDRRRFDA